MDKSPQLKVWRGSFGEDYIARNSDEQWKSAMGIRAFERILGQRYAFRSVLEVGSNIGLNLGFLRETWKHTPLDSVELYAVEPNARAFDILNRRTELRLAGAHQTDASALPFANDDIDLVFTSGVLIHIHPDELLKAASEIVRVARRWMLCIEYFSHKPEEIEYHGHSELLFKRDFGGFYLDHFPNLRVVDYGFLWEREFRIFDDLNWWLFEKQTTTKE